MMAASQDLLVRDLPCEVIGLRDETVDRWTLHSLRDAHRRTQRALPGVLFGGHADKCRRNSSSSAFSTFHLRILTVYLCTPLGVSLRPPKSEHYANSRITLSARRQFSAVPRNPSTGSSNPASMKSRSRWRQCCGVPAMANASTAVSGTSAAAAAMSRLAMAAITAS